jgi:hypothetical protein
LAQVEDADGVKVQQSTSGIAEDAEPDDGDRAVDSESQPPVELTPT